MHVSFIYLPRAPGALGRCPYDGEHAEQQGFVITGRGTPKGYGQISIYYQRGWGGGLSEMTPQVTRVVYCPTSPLFHTACPRPAAGPGPPPPAPGPPAVRTRAPQQGDFMMRSSD